MLHPTTGILVVPRATQPAAAASRGVALLRVAVLADLGAACPTASGGGGSALSAFDRRVARPLPHDAHKCSFNPSKTFTNCPTRSQVLCGGCELAGAYVTRRLHGRSDGDEVGKAIVELRIFAASVTRSMNGCSLDTMRCNATSSRSNGDPCAIGVYILRSTRVSIF